jgi:hypothetical protein
MLMDGYTAYQVRREENKDQLRLAAQWRLLRDAGLVYKIQIKRSVCWLLCQMGRALVALGEQLEQIGQPRLAAQ